MGTGIKTWEGLRADISQSLLLKKTGLKMIGKCLVLLCALGFSAATCIQVPQYQYQLRSPVVAGQVVSSPVELVSSPFVQYAGNNFFGGNVLSTGSAVSAVSTVSTDGPETSPLPVIQAPSVTLPAIQGPIVALPSQPIPAPRVLSQRCVCTKTVVKPQIIQRQVTVPKVQRYIKRTVTPVVENVSYKSRPITSQNGCSSAIFSRKCYSRVC